MAFPGQYQVQTRPTSNPGIAGDVHAPAAATPAVVTYALIATQVHVIGMVAWSYDSTPTGGNLTITDGATTILNLDIPLAGQGSIVFARPKRGTVGTAMVVTLASGAGGVKGKLTVDHWTEPPAL
jgi:hypothetical protein